MILFGKGGSVLKYGRITLATASPSVSSHQVLTHQPILAETKRKNIETSEPSAEDLGAEAGDLQRERNI